MIKNKNVLRKISVGAVAAIIFVNGFMEEKIYAKCIDSSIISSDTLQFKLTADPYRGLKKINLKDFFNQKQDDYYVYFYMVKCPYCNEVKDEMIKFASSRDNVYLVDYALKQNRPTKKYNWKDTTEKYNKKIGYIDENGEKVFLPGESEEKYKNMKNEFGKVMRFEFVTIDDQNIGEYKNASIGDIFTDVQTPEINYSQMQSYKDLMIAGVPTLFHIKNGRIDNFYFDSVEVSQFLQYNN